jgi:hypothetical protein
VSGFGPPIVVDVVDVELFVVPEVDGVAVVVVGAFWASKSACAIFWFPGESDANAPPGAGAPVLGVPVVVPPVVVPVVVPPVVVPVAGVVVVWASTGPATSEDMASARAIRVSMRRLL